MFVRELLRRLGDVPRHVKVLLVVLAAIAIASDVTHGTTRFVLINLLFFGFLALHVYQWRHPWGRGTSAR